MTHPRVSARMRRVRVEGTRPELVVRAALRARGIRFVANDRRLPGSPDLAVWDRRVAVFVHGCFWHAHGRSCLAPAPLPRTNRRFWLAKFARNAARDMRVRLVLESMGWRVVVVWECWTRGGAGRVVWRD